MAGVRRPSALAALAACALLGPPPAARADEPSPGLGWADTRAGRSPSEVLETPLSIGVVSGDEIRRARPAAGIEEALDLVPGVNAQSSGNQAQDARVSIRGFGARASFGVRGVKVLVDGVPTTLPDGQSELDSIDLAFAERVEVVRGPVSSLYGGGGGGVVSISTVEPTDEPSLRLRALFGSHHLSRQEALASGTLGEVGWVAGITHTRRSGYRDHSRSEQSVLLTKLSRALGPATHAELQFSNVWAPEAQDPGGLTAAEAARSRTAAAPNARAFDAGERLDQQKVALRVRRALGESGELGLTAYRLGREFRSHLPFRGDAPDSTGALINLDRDAWGGSLVWTQRLGRARGLIGADLDVQKDRRERYVNDAGAYGALRVDQSETVRAAGGFGELEVDVGGGFALVAGARWDWTEFVVGDRLVPPDHSDRIRMRELSPRFGLSWMRSPRLHVYANVATAFEVPTTTELAVPSLGGGFDTTLDPERTLGFELGAKGIAGARVAWELVLFSLRVRDALIPFENASGQTFFRNAGEVRRDGVEASLSARLGRGFSARAAYTFMNARYRDFDRIDASSGTAVELDGKREPNIPRNLLGAELRWDHPSGWFATLALSHRSDVEVNDENTAESGSYTRSDLRVGCALERGALRVVPFAGISNWSGAEYDGQLRPNAAFGRYYEPAPETELYAGVELRY